MLNKKEPECFCFEAQSQWKEKSNTQPRGLFFFFLTVFHYYEPARIERTIAERDHMQKCLAFILFTKGYPVKQS